MTHDEVENLRQAMLTVITNLPEHDLRNMAIIEDCSYCPECMKEVCHTKNASWDEDSALTCELTWIRAAGKLCAEGKGHFVPLIILGNRGEKGEVDEHGSTD